MGKRQRESEFQNLSGEEVPRRARDPRLPRDDGVAINARRSFVDFEAGASGDEGDTMSSMRGGRYRWRTWLRGRLPVVLSDLVPKGRSDCGAHEWYRADADTWRCYHCIPAIALSSPWRREEQLQHTLGGIDSTLRLLAHAGDADDEL
jgi:hypothetical protein